MPISRWQSQNVPTSSKWEGWRCKGPGKALPRTPGSERPISACRHQRSQPQAGDGCSATPGWCRKVDLEADAPVHVLAAGERHSDRLVGHQRQAAAGAGADDACCVRRSMPKRCAASLWLRPSSTTANRTAAYSSTPYIPRPVPNQTRGYKWRIFAPPLTTAASMLFLPPTSLPPALSCTGGTCEIEPPCHC